MRIKKKKDKYFEGLSCLMKEEQKHPASLYAATTTALNFLLNFSSQTTHKKHGHRLCFIRLLTFNALQGPRHGNSGRTGNETGNILGRK
jgi:hypothetical protein